MPFIQVSTTFEKKEDAQKMARHLTEKKLAGCVQIVGPIESTYWWENKIETTVEWLCLIKSNAARYETLEAEILRLHPYKTPEIIATAIVDGSPAYLNYLTLSVEKSGSELSQGQ